MPLKDSTETKMGCQERRGGSDPNLLQYWCYHCDKRVSIETLVDLHDVICYECKNGFVELIYDVIIPLPADVLTHVSSDPIDDPSFVNQFIQVLRLIAEATREEDAPPQPSFEHANPSDDDSLRIELDGWVDDGGGGGGGGGVATTTPRSFVID
ncbi:unnamed protein product [Fraxinus pennsylvanica]|uniref:RING-type E3 ubiquitin transferase n=1 Tax=Fraxinus pennsylvanica TaxID=56036 RepID=A0AAD2EB14_9LAMI|nr:unnamed protein product [Fraxinus pennsylvanica]